MLFVIEVKALQELTLEKCAADETDASSKSPDLAQYSNTPLKSAF